MPRVRSFERDSPMKATIIAVALLALLAGCGPKTEEECIVEAAKMPTQAGVALARGNCRNLIQSKTPKPAKVACESDAAVARAPRSEAMTQARAKLPALRDLDDELFVDVVHDLYYSSEPRSAIADFLGVKEVPSTRHDCQIAHPEMYGR